ncbi:MAG: hypothetical protein JSS04_27715 [Proteobacteria bacterium]|nr:hypothetical protein [Pseudomonadota bacterium]
MDALLLMRMAERLLGLLAGGLCVVLGYQLFIRLPDKADSAGKVILPGGVSIWLSRVGPGIFFALFGVAIIAYSFASTVRISEQTAAPVQASADTPTTTLASSRREISAMSDRSGQRVAREEREEQLTYLRLALANLNAAIDRLQRDTQPPERERLVAGLQGAKMLLLRGNWDTSWGDPARFQAWVNSGAVLPAPSGMDIPAGLYLTGQTR